MTILFLEADRLNFLKNISNPGISDKELLSIYQQGQDLQVLGELYSRYMELVYAVCLKYLKDPEQSRDAVMQIFEELVKKLHKHEVDNFKSWLHTVAKNHCLMQLRTPKNLKTTEFKGDLMQSEDEVHLNGVLSREENFQKLEKCLETLPSEQKLCVEMFYLQNKCYKEIAEQTGIDWNKVRSYIQNARRNLKICMEKSEQPTKVNIDNE